MEQPRVIYPYDPSRGLSESSVKTFGTTATSTYTAEDTWSSSGSSDHPMGRLGGTVSPIDGKNHFDSTTATTTPAPPVSSRKMMYTPNKSLLPQPTNSDCFVGVPLCNSQAMMGLPSPQYDKNDASCFGLFSSNNNTGGVGGCLGFIQASHLGHGRAVQCRRRREIRPRQPTRS